MGGTYKKTQDRNKSPAPEAFARASSFSAFIVQLSLKGEKFSRGETVSSERVDDFFNSVKPMLSDPTVKRGEVKRKHVTADCEYKRFWDSHVLADRYKCVCCVPPARSLSRRT